MALLDRFRSKPVTDTVPEGLTRCGTTGLDGEPIYFLMPADAPDHEVRSKAFELRHGRPPHPGELLLNKILEDDDASA